MLPTKFRFIWLSSLEEKIKMQKANGWQTPKGHVAFGKAIFILNSYEM